LTQGRSTPRIKQDYDEYPTIRQEILQWQTIRFTLVTVSAAAVAAIIGFTVQGLYPWQYFIVSDLLFIFLSVTVLLTWYAGTGNRKMGNYLIVFYEEEGKGWQSRMGVINDLSEHKAEKVSLNTLLTWFYLVLGLASFLLVFVNVPPKGPLPSPFKEVLSFGSPILLFGCFSYTLDLLRHHSSPGAYYRKLWRIIKRAEEVGMHRDEVSKFSHIPEHKLEEKIECLGGEKKIKDLGKGGMKRLLQDVARFSQDT